MQYLSGIDLGVATHTGRVRSSNEDDYLVLAPQDAGEAAGRGLLLCIADGMGGVAGGAEASRTAVRAAVQPFLRAAGPDGRVAFELAAVMAQAFEHAAAEVAVAASEEPHLRDMGTTLTMLHLRGGLLSLGHVGDTRCLLLRDGALRQLSEDHAVQEPEAFLTRCIGAGQPGVEADFLQLPSVAGDVLLLLSDGVWGTVPADEIARVAGTMSAQAAAEELIRHANRAGGPDNGTALVLRLLQADGLGEELLQRELPTEELRQPALLRRPETRFHTPIWPWLLLPLGLGLLVLGLWRWF